MPTPLRTPRGEPARSTIQVNASSRAEALGPRGWDYQHHVVPTEFGAMVDALTPREGELARLVAAGRTSAEVAALLGITVRTVDNQLGRVYRKLGLRGRRELEA